MIIIPLDELKVGQSGKLLDEIPYDLWDELTEGYEQDVVDWVNKVFVKGSVYGDDRVYAVIPKGTIIKLLTTHGPGAGWPMYEINGEEVDISGDLDEYRVILLDGSETSKYGYFVANDEIDEARLPEVIDTYNLDGFDVIRGNYLMKGTAENLHNFVSEELGVKGTLQEFVDAADKSFSKVRTVKDSKTVKDVNPRKGESKEDFISRFMEETKEEYPDQKQRLAIAYSYWERRNKKSTKDSDYSKNARNKFIIPAEPLGTIKVWYANENQIETDYNRLVEYAENHDPRQENTMLGVSSYDQTIGKTTKRVSEGYITLNGYSIVLIKDTDEDLVVDTMQDYYDEIADMTLEEFTKTFAANKEEFEEAFKRRNEEAKAEKKAAKDKEKELNKKRKSFEGLLTYENYISTRELLNKEFVPVSPDEDSCYIAVYEHLNNKDELYKVVSISYKSYGIAGSKAFGVNNPNYENDEKLCKIFILNLNDSEVTKKILNVKAIS